MDTIHCRSANVQLHMLACLYSSPVLLSVYISAAALFGWVFLYIQYMPANRTADGGDLHISSYIHVSSVIVM